MENATAFLMLSRKEQADITVAGMTKVLTMFFNNINVFKLDVLNEDDGSYTMTMKFDADLKE